MNLSMELQEFVCFNVQSAISLIIAPDSVLQLVQATQITLLTGKVEAVLLCAQKQQQQSIMLIVIHEHVLIPVH